MSISRTSYGIYGYNLTDKKDIFGIDDFIFSDKGEEITCFTSLGNIQLFWDQMQGEYLYFGYIFHVGEEWDSDISMVSLSELDNQEDNVKQQLYKYFNIIPEEEIKIIVFNQYT
jgi:hypothetical protein